MRLPSFCVPNVKIAPQQAYEPQQHGKNTVIITATTPEQAHLFRMINIWTKCNDAEHRMEMRKWR